MAPTDYAWHVKTANGEWHPVGREASQVANGLLLHLTGRNSDIRVLHVRAANMRSMCISGDEKYVTFKMTKRTYTNELGHTACVCSDEGWSYVEEEVETGKRRKMWLRMMPPTPAM